jgi:hypothetical protein
LPTCDSIDKSRTAGSDETIKSINDLMTITVGLTGETQTPRNNYPS